MGQGVWLDSEKLTYSEDLREVLKHGTLSIGFIGLAETLTVLYGAHHGQSQEMQEKGLKIIGFMRDYCDAKCEALKMNFSLLATPAEGLSGRFIRMDQKRYGKIKNVTDREYYTNSFHVPVWHDISIVDKIRINHPVDRDPICGYVGIIGDTCPRCGRREGETIPQEKLDELKRMFPEMPAFRGLE